MALAIPIVAKPIRKRSTLSLAIAAGVAKGAAAIERVRKLVIVYLRSIFSSF
jgi:hypothetical protein